MFKVVLLHLVSGSEPLGSQTDVISSVVLDAGLGQSVVHFSSRNVSGELIGESEPLRGCFSRFNTDGDFSSLHAKADARSSCKLQSLAVSVKVKSHPNFVLDVWLQVASDVHLVGEIVELKLVSATAVASSGFDGGRRHVHAAFSHQPVESRVGDVIVDLVREGQSLLGDGILVHCHRQLRVGLRDDDWHTSWGDDLLEVSVAMSVNHNPQFVLLPSSQSTLQVNHVHIFVHLGSRTTAARVKLSVGVADVLRAQRASEVAQNPVEFSLSHRVRQLVGEGNSLSRGLTTD